MTSEYIDSEMQSPETPFEARKYRVRYRCVECGHQWRSRWVKVVPKTDPPCPNLSCAQVRQLRQAQLEIQRLHQMLAEGRAPAQIGANVQVKAVDATAEIVMKDYGMTDLKDSIREGESMAPKLPQKAQDAADNYFQDVPKQAKMVDFGTGKMRSVQAKHLNAIAERAKKGAYRQRSVSPISIIPESMRKQPPLQLVRTSANPHFKG